MYDNRDNKDVTYKWDDNKRDTRTIGEMKQSGREYLSSILDLNKSHLAKLLRLKEKILLYLRARYGLDENDKLDLFFHFPYVHTCVTLHLHIRINHGLHPFDREYSFGYDEIVTGLSEGKTIADMILAHQEKNGRFYCMESYVHYYKGINGVTVNDSDENIFRLEKDQVVNRYSKDDLDLS